MRHLKSGRKLNRTPSHRKSMLFNLTISVLKYKKIKTTLVKAKEVRKIVFSRIVISMIKSSRSAKKWRTVVDNERIPLTFLWYEL